MRADSLVAVLLAAAGCGRLGFGTGGPEGPPADAAPDSSSDAPPSTCPTTRTVVGGVTKQLAAGIGASGQVVAWVDDVGAVRAARVSPTGQFAATHVLRAGGFTRVAGIRGLGANYEMVADDGNHERLFFVSGDLNTVTETGSGGPKVTSRPFTHFDAFDLWVHTDPGLPQVIIVDRLDAAAVPQTITSYNASAPITGLAIDEAPGHAHVLFGQQDGVCAGSDEWGTPPNLGFTTLSGDCREAHGANGNGDSYLLAYVDAAGAVRVYGEVTDFALSPSGHAPQVAADGTSLWIGWIDTRSTPTLQLARIDGAGTVTQLPLPDIHPLADESFVLVSDGVHTRLYAAEDHGTIAAVEPCL